MHEKRTNGDNENECEQESDQEGHPDGKGFARLSAPDGEGQQEDVDENTKDEATMAADRKTHLCGREKELLKRRLLIRECVVVYVCERLCWNTCDGKQPGSAWS